MAATVSVRMALELLGLGDDVDLSGAFVSGTTPVEYTKGYVVCGTTAGTIDFGDIAAGKPFILFIKAVVGNLYVKIGATTGIPVSTDSHLYIPEGECDVVHINPNATAVPGMRYVSDQATTGAFQYVVIGKA